MSRISRLNRSDVAPELRNIYDRYLQQRGNVPYFFRTVAHHPQIFQTMIAHMEAVLATGSLPTRLKELVVVRTSQLNCTAYCLASHTAISLKLGWTPDHIEALKNWQSSPLFSEAEKQAINLAEAMTLRSHDYTTQEMAELRRFYSEGEVVELLAAVGLFNYFNRFNNLLQMEPTQPATAEELAEAGIDPATA
ncbi:MAG: carboxymuconolactone decarboxylase family protein [Acidobacteria bacterium]|nr:carboxymuconolactone decarboxylase family protein [Acidobacteriota bacterium]